MLNKKWGKEKQGWQVRQRGRARGKYKRERGQSRRDTYTRIINYLRYTLKFRFICSDNIFKWQVKWLLSKQFLFGFIV